MPKKDNPAVDEHGNKVRMKPVVTIPLAETSGNEHVKQTEHVTITDAKGTREYTYERGKRVEMEPEAFIVLKRRYPNL